MKDLNDKFIISTAMDYDMEVEDVLHIYNICLDENDVLDSTEYYNRLEEFCETR